MELLQWAHATVRSRAEGEAVFARWFDTQGQVSETHTFESLWQEAGRIAHELRVSWGLAKGDRAVLCYGFGLDFFAAFLGCLRAGVLAVPVCEYSSVLIGECRVLVRVQTQHATNTELYSCSTNRVRECCYPTSNYYTRTELYVARVRRPSTTWKSTYQVHLRVLHLHIVC